MAFQYIIILLALILIYFSLRKILYKNSEYWQKRGVLLADGKLTGNMLDTILGKVSLADIMERIVEKTRELKVPYMGWLEFGQPVLVVRDLDIIKHILVKDFNHFVNRREFDMVKVTDSHNAKTLIGILENDAWKQMRSKVTPIFTLGKIKRMFGIFHESSSALNSFISQQLNGSSGVIDVSDAFNKFSAEAIASSVFGVNSQAFQQKHSDFEKYGEKLQLNLDLSSLLKMVLIKVLPQLGVALGWRFFDKNSDIFFRKVVLEALRERRKVGIRREDFLQLLIDTQNESPSTFDDDLIAANCLTFILAGFDTTQALLVFIAYQLALCPDVQENVFQEINSYYDPNGVDQGFTHEAINQMEYLDKVFNETLRLYPLGVRVERQCTSDYCVPQTGLVIKKGQVVIIPAFSLHRDPEYYPDPLKFDPERFSPENKAQRNPYSYLGFGQGPRSCIGTRFAMVEIKVAIVRLLHKYKLEPCEETLTPMTFMKNTIFLKPEKAIKLRITCREDVS